MTNSSRPTETRIGLGSGVLAMLTDPDLREELDRVGAAVGVRVVHAGGDLVSRKAWSAAAAVVLDEAAAQRCG